MPVGRFSTSCRARLCLSVLCVIEKEEDIYFTLLVSLALTNCSSFCPISLSPSFVYVIYIVQEEAKERAEAGAAAAAGDGGDDGKK